MTLLRNCVASPWCLTPEMREYAAMNKPAERTKPPTIAATGENKVANPMCSSTTQNYTLVMLAHALTSSEMSIRRPRLTVIALMMNVGIIKMRA